jgi:hypothetical protein
MRFKSLTDLKRREPREIFLAALPLTMPIIRFALDKAFKISELVRHLFQESFEWYGFTLAAREQPETVIDIGLPRNDENILEYVSLSPEKIAAYQETLPPELVINGWVHSHGSLDFKKFSAIDDANQRTVLDYVTTKIPWPRPCSWKRCTAASATPLSSATTAGTARKFITCTGASFPVTRWWPVKRRSLLCLIPGSPCPPLTFSS